MPPIEPQSTEEVAALPVDERALYLVRTRMEPPGRGAGQSKHNTLMAASWTPSRGLQPSDEAMFAIAEAWAWAENRGLIAPYPEGLGRYGDAYFRTRLAEGVLAQREPLEHVRAVDQLQVPLHPRIESRVRAQFLLGEHETAVFLAIREVEIRIRELAGYGDEQTGVAMIRDAFKVEPPGPLTDESLPAAERQATMELFSGPYGVFRNPSGHREVPYEDPGTVVRILLLADLLLRLLDTIEQRRTG